MGFFFAFGAAITWGLVYTFDQRILSNLTPLGLLFIDSILSLVIALPILLWRQGQLEATLSAAHSHWMLIVGSLVLAAIANYCIYSGIRLIGASTASMLEITYPFFVALFSAMLLNKSANLFFILGGVLILAGVVLILRLG